ncbi:MAG: hypothetical protein IPO02_14315 [Bacteroidetes bacterium]|nr:hypothetical protein [Bacteroidota bacterium]
MKPSILVIYFSQSGQLKQIIDNMLAPIQAHCTIEMVEIKPIKPFPFPWTADTFFDCMPECVQQIPEEIHTLQFAQQKYDLVILGYQPWFLSPSIPINSFLQSAQASILSHQKVLTVIGSRNMWLHAQEKIKEQLNRLQAQLVGNIVFFDTNPNLTSVLTIIRWTFKGGKKQRNGCQKRCTTKRYSSCFKIWSNNIRSPCFKYKPINACIIISC